MNPNRILINVDLWIQSILLLLIIVYGLIPDGFFIAIVFFAFIGGWQLISSIIWVWPFRDRKRYPYLIIVTVLYGLILPIVTAYSQDLLDKISVIYTIFNPLLIGIWYYIITWRNFIKIKKTK